MFVVVVTVVVTKLRVERASSVYDAYDDHDEKKGRGG